MTDNIDACEKTLCIVCGKDKREGSWPERHARCRSCFSEQAKASRLKRMSAKGIEPKRIGKSPNCYWCGALKENPKAGLCNPCRAEEARQYRAKKRADKGLLPFGEGRGPNCTSCGVVRENPNAGYCNKCAREKNKAAEAVRVASGLPSYKEGINPNCYSCGKLKENPKQGYCYECKNVKERERMKRTGKTLKHRTGKCACGKDFCSYSSYQCSDCSWKSKKLKINTNVDVFFKEAMRSVTKQAIKKGFLIKQPCEVCGNDNVDAHHEDYTQPLKVMWLCRLHHMRLHAEKIKLNKDF